MTIESKRQLVAADMGFKDPGFLKWLDGVREAEESLIKREQAAGSNASDPDYAIWEKYVGILEGATAASYGGALHADGPQRLDAYLKATKLVL